MDNAQSLTVDLLKPVHGGAVLAHAGDAKTLFVRGGLPGEKVKARVTSDHKRHAWAEVTSVVDPSPERVKHVWPLADEQGIGGAELGHVSPSYQTTWKTLVLHDSLKRIGGGQVYAQVEALPQGVEVARPPRDERALQSEDPDERLLLHRRTRVQLTADRQRRLGMKKYRSNEVVPLDEMPLASKNIEGMGALSGKAWRKLWNPGQRISLEAPNGSPAVAVTRKGVYKSSGKLGPSRSVWHVPYLDRTYRFETAAGSFWQTHRDAPGILAISVVKAAKPQPGQMIAELYSGAGLFTRFLAQAVGPTGKVVSLEGSGRAVKDAGGNLADLIESGQVELFEGTVSAANIASLISQLPARINTVVLDPPRSGASSAVTSAIINSAAERVVLVSCDVAAGSRDLKELVAGGFELERIDAWDLFPHTHHIEMVSALLRS